MSGFEVAPNEVRAVGAQIRAYGPSVQGTAAEIASVNTVSEPTQTAAALGQMSASWFAGLSRLADDIQIFGGLTQLAANGYEVVDRSSMPDVVTEDAPAADPWSGLGGIP